MPKPRSAIYDYIVRELAPTDHDLDEAPITVAREAHGVPGGVSAQGTITMRPKAGITPEEARAISKKLQARVKGLCHLEASGDEAA
ncbi:MAG: hypothetical protein H7346_19690 [Burkholderiaceae bacterium]|nr:hypothetical protein [Burkholderiaceae bacterium]